MALVYRHLAQENGAALGRPPEEAQEEAGTEPTCNGHTMQGEPDADQAAVEALPEANGHAGKRYLFCNTLWPANGQYFTLGRVHLQCLKAPVCEPCWLMCLSGFSPGSACRGIRARGYDAGISCGRLRGVCNLHA